MTTESSGSRTKNDLDRALRQLLEDRPLDQLRIRELTSLCGSPFIIIFPMSMPCLTGPWNRRSGVWPPGRDSA